MLFITVDCYFVFVEMQCVLQPVVERDLWRLRALA